MTDTERKAAAMDTLERHGWELCCTPSVGHGSKLLWLVYGFRHLPLSASPTEAIERAEAWTKESGAKG